jgi:hypothetical protein
MITPLSGPDLPFGTESEEDFLPGPADEGDLWWGGHDDEYDYTTRG